jgi:regulator of protease activity HflC (stomatin/prohibitin superfamily)
MTYENAEIQKAIDNTIIAQQLKVVNEARFVAQRRENDRIELEANATAERARWIAAGKADAEKVAAAPEAEAIRGVNRALAEAKENPLLYQLRTWNTPAAQVSPAGTSGALTPTEIGAQRPFPHSMACAISPGASAP